MKLLYATFIIWSCLIVCPVTIYSQLTHSWSYQFGGGSSDLGHQIIHDNVGNIYLTGEFASSADFGTGGTSTVLQSAGSWDVFLAKYNNNGELDFVFNIAGEGDATGSSLTVDLQGNIIICGTFEGTADFDPGPGLALLSSTGSFDIFIAKYDPQGNFINALSLGGEFYDQVHRIYTDKEDNIYLSGVLYDTIDFDLSSNEELLTSLNPDWGGAFIVKYDSVFNMVFAHAFSSPDGEILIYEILPDDSGNLFITGEFSADIDFDQGPGNTILNASIFYNAFLAKYDSVGNFLFAFDIGDDNNVTGTSLALDESGNVYIGGFFTGDADFDGGVGTYTLHSNGNKVPFLAKYTNFGAFIKAIKFDGVNGSIGFGNSIATDLQSNLYIAGTFSGEIDFDGGNNLEVLISSDWSWDIFLVKYDSALLFIDGFSIGGVDTDLAASCTHDPDGNIYITGVFNGEADFDPGPGESILTSNGYDDIFLAKYSQGMVHTTDMPTSTTTGFKIFPNPASNLVYLDTREAILDAHVLIINLAGQVVGTYKGLSGNHFVADISALPPGIYILELAGDGKAFREKVVVER